jgi:hypothetical protein
VTVSSGCLDCELDERPCAKSARVAAWWGHRDEIGHDPDSGVLDSTDPRAPHRQAPDLLLVGCLRISMTRYAVSAATV